MRKLSSRTKVILFVLFNLLSISLVFYFTFSPETLTALKDFNYPSLILLFLVWFSSAAVETVSFIFFIKGAGSTTAFFEAFQLTVIKNMFNVITPLNMGGHPMAIYMLSKRGVPAGRGTSIVITKMIVFSFVSLLGSLTAFFFYSRELQEQSVIRIIFLVSAGIFLLLILLFIFMALFPSRLIGFLTFLSSLFKRAKFKDKTYKTIKKKIVREVFISRKSIRLYFRSNLGYFLLGILFTALFYCINVILLWVILMVMGISIPFLRGCMLSAVQQALLAFQPIPGGAGVGDGTFYLLFQSNIPKHLMGIAILLWRFFTQFISALTGSLLLGIFFSKKNNKSSVPEGKINPPDDIQIESAEESNPVNPA